MNEKQITLILSSDPNAGADSVSTDGSYFTVDFQEHFVVPHNAQNCVLEMHSATVWWVIPNISNDLGNNKFYYEWGGNPYHFTVPDGLYNLADLSNALQREILNQTGETNVISLEADEATQKVQINFLKIGMAIDFTQANTIRTVIGFNSDWYPNSIAPHANTQVQSVLAPNVAAFNSIEYFLIHCDLIGDGMLVNNNYSQTIGKVPINVHPGSQIVYEPNNPIKINANELIGQRVGRLACWLTDQNGNRGNTNGESFACTVLVRYYI